jgi:nucleotide-binding universal stress UspA family protein
MYEKILFPTDIYDHNTKPVEQILKLKEAGAKEVHLLHVLTPSDWGFLKPGEYDSKDSLKTLAETLDEGYREGLLKRWEIFEELSKNFTQKGFNVRIVFIPGELDEIISAYSEKHNINLVVLGINEDSLSFNRVGRVLDILKSVKKPVLIVKS